MALYSFVDALKDLEVEKDLHGAELEVSAVRTSASDCKSEELKDVKTDPKLLTKIDVFMNVCDIVMSIIRFNSKLYNKKGMYKVSIVLKVKPKKRYQLYFFM